MSKKTKILIKDTIEKLEQLINSNFTQETQDMFKNIPPVLWFGNLKSSKEKILVISANPNRPDVPEKNPPIPYSIEWKKGGRDVKKLEDNFNNYFQHIPATNWFGQKDKKTVQGRIEQFLNGLDASFYENDKYTYQAIHIDLLPFSTAKSFTKIANNILLLNGLTAWIDEHVRDLISLTKPKIIIINGIGNFNYFNLCVNLGAQPYRILKCNSTTLWISDKNRKIPAIIGVSTNMGSGCRKHWKEVYMLGQQVKKYI